MNDTTHPSLTEMVTEQAWDDAAEVFGLMCPLTRQNCHSLCACYEESRTTTACRGTCEDIAFRGDGYTSGRCDVFGFDIGAYRD